MLHPSPINCDGFVVLVDDTRQCHHAGGIISNDDSVCTKCWNMNFALFSTCKQIYRETKDLLWKRNTLVLDLEQASKYRFPSPFEQVVNLELDITFGVDGRIATSRFWSTLPKLELLLKAGSLSTLTLKMRGVQFIQDYPAYFGDLGELGAWRDVLSNANLRLGFLQKKMIIDTVCNSCEPQSREYEATLGMSAEQDVLAIIRNLHGCFGGQLWQDGRLCYEDGREISPLFKLGPKLADDIEE